MEHEPTAQEGIPELAFQSERKAILEGDKLTAEIAELKQSEKKGILECDKLTAELAELKQSEKKGVLECDKLTAEIAELKQSRQKGILEGHKLIAEIMELRRRVWWRPGFYAALAPSIVAAFGLAQLWIGGYFQVHKEQLNFDVAQLQEKKDKLSARNAALEAGLSELVPPLLQFTDPQHRRVEYMLSSLRSLATNLDKSTNVEGELQGRIRGALSQSFQDLGDYKNAQLEAQKAVAVYMRSNGPRAAVTLDSKIRELDVLEHRGQYKTVYMEAQKVLKVAQQCADEVDTSFLPYVPNISQWIAFSSAELGLTNSLEKCDESRESIRKLQQRNPAAYEGWKQFDLRLLFLKGRIVARSNTVAGWALMQAALSSATNNLEKDHIWPKIWTPIYANVCVDVGSNAVSIEAMITNAVRDVVSRLSENHPDALMVQAEYARFLSKSFPGRLMEAEGLWTNALEKLADANPAQKARMSREYAEFLMKRGIKNDYTNAADLLLGALKTARETFPGPSGEFPGAQEQCRVYLTNLIEVYGTNMLKDTNKEAEFKKQLSDL